jgi:ADP-heptose:LPS heptosyltransferase
MTSLMPPLILVRISAIGDTILSARTQGLARHKGYSPFLLTHESNASLLHCMPLLGGACLSSETGFKYLLQTDLLKAMKEPEFSDVAKTSHTSQFTEVEQHIFFRALRSGLNVERKELSTSFNADPAHVPIVDLQATRRSRRVVRAFKEELRKEQLATQTLTVAKLTLWRVALVIWSFFAFKQRAHCTPPRWLQARLKPVRQLQKELMDRLPDQHPARSEHSLNQTRRPRVLQIVDEPQHRDHSHHAQGRIDEIPKIQRTQHIVLLLGSSYKLKSWPQEHFRALTELILLRTNHTVVLCGGPNDARVAEFIAFPPNDRIINRVGQTSLAETLRWIGRASYVVTGDSFASHAADLLDTPASVLFGSTHPLLGFAPEGSHVTVHHSQLSCSPCNRHGQGECRFKNLKCLTSIKPEEVFLKIEQSLERERQKSDTPLTGD